jgi:DNA-binding LacI/PurR family transcriptional regulator
MRQQLGALRQYNVDAVIILVSAAVLSAAELAPATEGRAAVFINRTVPESHLFSVSCDNKEGARAIADHLYATGSRRAALVCGRPGSVTDTERRHAFVARLAELGMVLTANISSGEFSYRAGHRAAVEIARSRSTDAVFCSTDILAAGVMDRLRDEFGVAIPRELSVIGFDDIDMASWPHYALTTFRYPVDAVVDRTIQLLLEWNRESIGICFDHRLSGELVIRESTAGNRHRLPATRRSERPPGRSAEHGPHDRGSTDP